MNKDEICISIVDNYSLIKKIRNIMLRPGQPIESCIFPYDKISIHLGLYKKDKLVSIISFSQQNLDSYDRFSCWQFRGMTTLSAYSRLGYGKTLLNASIDIVKDKKADYFWCNARESALMFYKKLNFKIISDRFIVPVSGPHYKMVLDLNDEYM